MENIENLIGLRIQNVYCKKNSPETSGYVRIVIQLSEDYLQLTVDDETDEIVFRVLSKMNVSILSKPLWADRIEGKSVMQIWGMENEKGYSDLLCLGLNEVVPTIVFSTLASEIKVGFVQYVKKK